MRAREFDKKLATFVARVRVPGKSRTDMFYTTIQARNAQQARLLLRAQYGSPRITIDQPRKLSLR